MAKKHQPVDHKDSDAEYAAQVQGHVAKRLGVELLPISSKRAFYGRWKSSFKFVQDKEYDVEHLADGTMLQPLSEHKKPGKWQYKAGVYTQTTWVPPIPEYGIEDPSWNQECYRCAQTADGRIVYWNGD